MMRLFSTAASGMQAQELRISVISNNIANINTTGYQRQRAEFEDLFYQNFTRAGSSSSDSSTTIPTGIQVGLGAKTGGVYRIPSQGELTQTSSPLDVAITGKGFFRVELPDGTNGYTRAGSFQINENGEIVTSKGYKVTPTVTIPQDAISVDINASGQVIATISSSPDPQTLGQLDMADFVNSPGLKALGDNLFAETKASGSPIIGVAGVDQFGSILQGWLESSNVNPVNEITDLIAAQRAYELNSKVIQAGDEMMQAVNQTA